MWKDLIRHQDNDFPSSLKEFVYGVDVNNHLTDENGILSSGDGAVRISGMISLGLDCDTKTPVIYVTFPRGFKGDEAVLSVKIKFNNMEAFNTAKLVDYRLQSEALFTPSEKSFIIWDNIIKGLTH